MSNGNLSLDIVRAVWGGVVDALAFHRSFIFFITSKTVRVRTLQCFLMNGVIFVGRCVCVYRPSP